MQAEILLSVRIKIEAEMEDWTHSRGGAGGHRRGTHARRAQGHRLLRFGDASAPNAYTERRLSRARKREDGELTTAAG